MVAIQSLPMLCRQEGLRTVVFDVSNVLLAAPQDTGHSSFLGNQEARNIVLGLSQGGIATAVWDDGPSGAAPQLRSALGREYTDLFERQFFSAEQQALFQQLGATREEVLLVTGDIGHWSYAVCEGIRTCFYRMFEDGEGPHPLRISLLKSLGAFQDGGEILADPVGYLRRLKTVAKVVRQFGAEEKSFKRFLGHFDESDKISPLTAELKAAAVDWIVWTGSDSLPPLEASLQDLPIDPDLLPLPRYKTSDQMRREFRRFFGDRWRRIDEAPPSLAKAAFLELTEELARTIAFPRDGFDLPSELTALSWEIFRERVSSSRNLLVDRLGLLTAAEWEALAAALREDHAALDARYAGWVTGVVRSVRQMVSLGKNNAEISDYVYESLYGGLFCRILTMEMDVREQQETRPPFLHRHDMKGLVTVLIMNRKLIEAGHTSWATYARRGSVREWVEAMLFPLIELASPHNVHLEISFNRGGKQASIPLTVFSEPERDALGHVLIELVRNGIKYRKPGSIMSKVSVRVKESEENLEIVVRDNGVGIQDTEKVWERGIRERPDLAEGDGDGLPSIMRHVSKWNWRINIDSKPGEGCAFTLSIPFSDHSRGAP